MLLSLCGLSGFASAQESASCTANERVMVIDAGSTGTRLHVYAYDATTKPVTINECYVKKITPGLAKINENATAVEAYLEELFQQVPAQHMPVYFYATGGMRLRTPAAQDYYYQLIQAWFAQHPQWAVHDVRTISGQEEGLFDWLALNKQLNRLENADRPLVNVMDLGGASVQMVFPVESNEYVPASDAITIELPGRSVKLFDHSYLGLGMMSIEQRFQGLSACATPHTPLADGRVDEASPQQCADAMVANLHQTQEFSDLMPQTHAGMQEKPWYMLGAVAQMATHAPFFFPQKVITADELLEQAKTLVCQTPLMDEHNAQDCLTAAYYEALTSEALGWSPSHTMHLMPDEASTDWTLGVVVRQVLSPVLVNVPSY